MAKRKAVMKNIIYELDNDDIEISSEDEVSSPKVTRVEVQGKDKSQEIDAPSESNGVEVLNVDLIDDSICLIDSPNPIVNGGKTNSATVVSIDSPDLNNVCEINSQDEAESDCVVQRNSDSNNIIMKEDADVDSPLSLPIAGCENRIPLVTIKFKNSKLSGNCKNKLKEFLINLLKQQQGDRLVESENDTDHELDIWPEDLIEECIEVEKPQIDENSDSSQTDKEDSLFFVDTVPCQNLTKDIPKYCQVSSVITNVSNTEVSPQKSFRRSPKCFNCDGAHWLRDCTYPKHHGRIAEKRQQNSKVGRYHIEDEQKYGHLTPGRLSGDLRHALGLKRNAIPPFIYRMRVLGYPPGWLEEARISHSGLAMFDSTGTAILDPDEEDGELCEVGSKDKFDMKKILDFPGFNVPASSRYVEQAHLYGLPPMSEQDSKILMLQKLAPNAMKAYKRKKLALFPTSGNNILTEGPAEMDLDSGDEQAAFPSVPPLPDEAPPPLPPPLVKPPPPPSSPPPLSPPGDVRSKADKIEDTTADLDNSDLEITSVMRVSNIPIPEDSLIVIDECYDNENPDSEGTSPSLDDLEKTKQVLMEALDGDPSSTEPAKVTVSEDTNIGDIEPSDKVCKDDTESEKTNVESNEDKSDEDEIIIEDATPSASSPGCKVVRDDTTVPETVSTPEPKTGHVKTTSLGTPVLNIASSFVKLPSDDKFSNQICDVINFENLPNTTGKYMKIRTLLKRVKTKVDIIQDS